jgi:integrase
VALRRVYRPLIERFNKAAALALEGADAGKILETAQARVTRHVLEKNSGKLDLSGLADLLIKAEDLNIEKGSPEYIEFVETLASLTIDAAKNHAQSIEGDLTATPVTPLGKQAYEQAIRTAASGETITELFEQYAKIRVAEGRKRLDGIAQDRMVIHRFSEYVGPSRSVGSITVNDARGFRDIVAKLPKGYSKRNDYRGLSIQQVVEKADRDGAVRMSDITRDRYISTVSPLFDWLVSEGRGDIKVNPFNGLHQRTTRGKNPRPPFSLQQLNDILSSPLFTGFEADGKEHITGTQLANNWRYWIPIIGMFSGARITEIAQLHVENIVPLTVSNDNESDELQEHKFFFEFKEDSVTGQQTKSKKSRIVPVHSKLIALGFLAYVDKHASRAKHDGNTQLFPELCLKGSRSRLGDRPARFWRDYLQDIGIKKGADGIGAHSFRHTLADRLRNAGFLDAQFGPLILGHSDKSVTGGYGNIQQGTAKMRLAMLEAVKFSDLDFSNFHTSRV